jgi:subtilisin
MFDPNIVSQLAYSVPVLLVVFGYLILRERKLREAEEARDARHRELVEAQQTVVKLVADQHERATERIAGTFNAIVERHEAVEKEDRAAQREMSKSVVSALVESANAKHAMAGALRDLSRQLHKSNDSFSLLSQEVHAMNHSHGEPEIRPGLPGYHPGDRLPYEAVLPASMLSLILSDRRPWSHAPLGIPALYAAGIRGKGATVAVIDTGGDRNHQDLAANLDAVSSRDFTGSRVGWADVNSHGTHCSGIIAADDQGVGVIGVAPDAAVVIYKGLGDGGSGGVASLVGAIQAAANHPKVQTLSMSFGASGPIPEIERALIDAEAKGKWLVAAAGNSGPNSTNWPGAYDNVLCVGAVKEDLTVDGYSSTNKSLDVVAPGSRILSTIPNNQYASLSGTSMATPYVAGVLANAESEIRKLPAGTWKMPTQKQMMQAAYDTSKDIGLPGHDNESGAGLIQPAAFIAELVRVAKANVGTSPKPDPTPGQPVRIAVPDGAKFLIVDFGTA